MTAPVRRGGRGTLADGGLMTWSVAEGARGRRWRATIVRDGSLRMALLLETDAVGRTSRLEVDAAAGLLTLHPDPDERELHGNVVTPSGIVHLAFGWSPRHELLVAGVPLVGAAVAARLSGSLGLGDRVEVDAVVVGPDLGAGAARGWIERRAARAWRFHGLGIDDGLDLDPDGLPAALGDPATWPLER